MLSEELLSDGVVEFLEFSASESNQVRHKQYVVYKWRDDGGRASTHTVAIPRARDWHEDLPDSLSTFDVLLETIAADDDIPLIQSRQTAAQAISRLIEEIHIESSREEIPRQEYESEFYEALHGEQVTVQYVAPIMGLSFETSVELTDTLEIRPISDFEKELMLNARDLGGGSVALRQIIETGNLTHAAVYTVSRADDNEWNTGLSVLSEHSKTVYDELESLQTALRLCHPGQFEMGIQHTIDKTFYPVVVSSQEDHGMSPRSYIGEPDTITAGDELEDYFQKVSNVDEDDDEGLRVAINRLESSSRKVSNADGIVDAVIGIEALLSSGRSGRFQEVRRSAAVLSGEKATYSELGYLQDLRNATVHGTDTTVDRADLEQAQDFLSTLISRTIELMIEHDISRDTLVKELDTAIETVTQEELERALSAFDSR